MITISRATSVRAITLAALVALHVSLLGAPVARAQFTLGQQRAGTASGTFLKIGLGARASGLGESFVAVANDPTAIFWYNGLHLLTSLAIGLFVTWLIEQAERFPAKAHLVLLIIVAGFVVTILGVGWLTTPMRAVLPWWSIVVANALAVLLAGFYLLQKRPGLLGRFFPFAG